MPVQANERRLGRHHDDTSPSGLQHMFRSLPSNKILAGEIDREDLQFQSAVAVASAGQTPPTPALLISTSIRPSVATISPTIRATCESYTMSASQDRAPRPSALATDSICGDLSMSASCAPRSLNSSAIAFPIRLAAPVMRTTLPEKSKTRENSSALSSAKPVRDIQCTSMFSCLTGIVA